VAAWTSKEWYLYTINGKFVKAYTIPLKMPLMSVDFGVDDKTYLIVKSGTDRDNDMAIEVQDQSIEPFEFHSAIAVSKDKSTLNHLS
jgi:hypothetical protein